VKNLQEINLPAGPSAWRVRDIVYVLVAYFLVLFAVILLELNIFGAEALGEAWVSPWVLLVERAADAAVLVLLPVIFIKRVYRRGLAEIGFGLKGLRKNVSMGLSAGLVLWIAATVIEFAMEGLFGEGPGDPYLKRLQTSDDLIDFLVILFTTSILAPFSEEFYYRGFTYTILSKRFGVAAGVAASSLFFAAMHFSLYWFPGILVIGAGLALLYARTKSLAAPITAHAMVNLLTVCLNAL
jgi:membrane protease YdiL (CAAX protease family)